MKACTLACALSFVVFGSYSVSAQQVPRFDIAAGCKAALALTPEDKDPIRGCIQDETDAERQLQTIWSSAAATHRETCTAKAQLVGPPSYVDLLVCLQMYEGEASVAPPRRRRQP